MKKRFSPWAITLAAATVMASGAWAKDNLKVELEEWGVSLDKQTVSAGDVRITVRNRGSEVHELVFIRLNDASLRTGNLPVAAHGGIEEGSMSAFGELVDEIEDIGPREKEGKTISLPPGRYAVVCNVIEEEEDGSIEAHYSMGMHALLTVE